MRRSPYPATLAALAALSLFAAAGCSAQDSSQNTEGAPQAAADPAVGQHTGDGEDAGAMTPAGPLQGNWRVTRPGDPSDASLMRVQIIHDANTLEGSYVLHQPFCGIDLPPVQAGTAQCEFDGVAGEVTGEVINYEATIKFAPGADGLEHQIIFETEPATEPATGPLRGRYVAPGETEGVPVILARAPE